MLCNVILCKLRFPTYVGKHLSFAVRPFVEASLADTKPIVFPNEEGNKDDATCRDIYSINGSKLHRKCR